MSSLCKIGYFLCCFFFTKVAFLTLHIFIFSVLLSLINLIMLYSAHFSISFGIIFQHHPRAQIIGAFKNEWALPRSSILFISEFYIQRDSNYKMAPLSSKSLIPEVHFHLLQKSHIVTLNNYTSLKAMPGDIVYIEKDKKTRKYTLLKW